MERVTFLLDDEPGVRISCLLNPESLVLKRQAGIRSRGSTVGRLTGVGMADDAVLLTGGGRTELDLDLLFDTAIAGSTVQGDDVRALTQPLWHLAENSRDASGRLQAPQVRFVWGKAWNLPAVVVSVAERLERFTRAGVPQRSWLRMKLWRLADPPPPPPSLEELPPLAAEDLVPDELDDLSAKLGAALGESTHQMVGDGEGGGERLDQLAQHYYGHPSYWRLLARANQAIEDPHQLPANLVLRVPPLPSAAPRSDGTAESRAESSRTENSRAVASGTTGAAGSATGTETR